MKEKLIKELHNINKRSESREALMRIIVAIITGIILGIWRMLVVALIIINFIVTLFTGKRNKEIAEFCEIWNTQFYVFMRYITFVNNERPFPFGKMSKNISNFEK